MPENDAPRYGYLTAPDRAREDYPEVPARHEEPATVSEAEVQAEARTAADPLPEGAQRVHLGPADAGIDLIVPDRRTWRSSALGALNSGDFQTWADATLTEDDAVAFEEYDPTLAEMQDFLTEIRRAFGDEPGKPGRSNFGSRAQRRGKRR